MLTVLRLTLVRPSFDACCPPLAQASGPARSRRSVGVGTPQPGRRWGCARPGSERGQAGAAVDGAVIVGMTELRLSAELTGRLLPSAR